MRLTSTDHYDTPSPAMRLLKSVCCLSIGLGLAYVGVWGLKAGTSLHGFEKGMPLVPLAGGLSFFYSGCMLLGGEIPRRVGAVRRQAENS